MATLLLSRRGRDVESNTRPDREVHEANRHMREFLAVLGHELGNHLTAIRYTLCVLEQQGDDPVRREWVRCLIERQTQSMSSLIEGLLDISRIELGKIQLSVQSLELAQVVAQAVETVLPFIEARGQRLEVTLPMQTVSLEADPVRLVQVLMNLLNNAAKYTQPGGRIWLMADVEGSHVVLQVRDSGMGIAQEILSQVFDPFWQGNSTQGGLGIGLALVRKLIELHGGSVSAHSEGPGCGSEFTVRLPIHANGINGQEIALPPL